MRTQEIATIRHMPPLSARALRHLALILICFAWTAIPLFAQFDAAAVLGTIRDGSGAVVPGATVSLKNVSTNLATEATADAKGDYQFPLVQVGDYVLSVTKDGFAPASSQRFTVQIGARQRVDISLTPGSTSQEVTVSAVAQALETDTSDRGETIQSRQAVDLPLNGRSYADLAVLVPGVKKSTLESSSYPARDASYNVNGLTSQDNNFQLDGIDNNAYQEANQGYSNQAVVPSPDAIQEFKVQTDNFSAEFGRAGGAIINATIKSGGSSFHGSVYDYLRNTALNAYGPFIGLGVKPTLVQNQYGATLGGPVRGLHLFKDRLFFFADYEAVRSYAHVLTQASLPTSAERGGLFTADGTPTGTAVPIKNPYTGVVYANGQVPLSDPNVNPLAVYVLTLLPSNNIPGAAIAGNTYQYMGRNTTLDDRGDGRADFIVNAKQNGFFRYSQRAVSYYIDPPFPGIAGGNSNGLLYSRTRQLAFGYNWSPTPTSILEFRYGQTWTESGKQPVNLGANNLLQQFNIPNAVTDPRYAGGLNSQIVNGFTQFGEQTTNPQFTNPTQWNPKVNYNWVHGRHSLKVGYEFAWLDQAISDFHPKFGSDSYAGGFSSTTAIPTNGSIAVTTTKQAAGLADFLFGARNTYSLNNIAEVNYQRYWHMLYIQDDWKPFSKLTINAGLRYEFFSPNFEQNNHILNYDPVNNRILHAGTGTDVNTIGSGGSSSYNIHYVGGSGLASRALINPDYKDFAPRIGFAYQVLPKTVVRGAYGISYAPLFRFGGEGLLAYNGPDIINATVTQKPSQGLCVTQAGSLTASLTLNPFTCFRRMQDGYESNFASAQNYNSAGAQTRYIPQNFATPYVQAYHLSVQQQLPYATTLEVSYVGTHGLKIPALADLNQATPCTAAQVTAANCPSFNATTNNVRRPIPNFIDILTETNAGFLIYNSLQTKLEHRFQHGIFLTNAFTWSHSLNNSAPDLEASNGSGDSAVVNMANIRGDRGTGSFNQPYNDTLSVIADLPFGRGHDFFSHTSLWQEELIGGWQLTAINVVTSGLPLNLTYTPVSAYSVSSTSVSQSYRPNLVSTPQAVYGTTRVKTNTYYGGYLNVAQLTIPAGSQVFGNAPRNALRGPAFGQLDLAAHKKFDLGFEHAALEFRIEAFNILNATNYTLPDSTVTDGTFGQFSNSISSVYPSRQVQAALRLSF
jgi:hypothetical protein